jgi:hypothetical protein
MFFCVLDGLIVACFELLWDGNLIVTYMAFQDERFADEIAKCRKPVWTKLFSVNVWPAACREGMDAGKDLEKVL